MRPILRKIKWNLKHKKGALHWRHWTDYSVLLTTFYCCCRGAERGPEAPDVSSRSVTARRSSGESGLITPTRWQAHLRVITATGRHVQRGPPRSERQPLAAHVLVDHVARGGRYPGAGVEGGRDVNATHAMIHASATTRLDAIAKSFTSCRISIWTRKFKKKISS